VSAAAPDPHLDLLVKAVQYVNSCHVGDRAVALMPDGRAYLMQATDEGVAVTLAQDDDELVLWMMPSRGEA